MIINPRLAVFPPNLYADPSHPGATLNFDSLTDIGILLANLIEFVIALAAALAVIYVIYAGIQYASSQGDPGKTKDAKNAITYAVFGIILSAGSYIIVDFVARNFS